MITGYSISNTVPCVGTTELSTELSTYILAWRYNWTILDQMQGNDTIATIGLGQGLYIVTSGGIYLLIPCERATEGSSKLGIYWSTWSWSAILSQVHCHNTIATIHLLQSLYIITCYGIDLTIPVVLTTEDCIKLGIYWSTWSWSAILGQVQGHNTITTC